MLVQAYTFQTIRVFRLTHMYCTILNKYWTFCLILYNRIMYKKTKALGGVVWIS